MSRENFEDTLNEFIEDNSMSFYDIRNAYREEGNDRYLLVFYNDKLYALDLSTGVDLIDLHSGTETLIRGLGDSHPVNDLKAEKAVVLDYVDIEESETGNFIRLDLFNTSIEDGTYKRLKTENDTTYYLLNAIDIESGVKSNHQFYQGIENEDEISANESIKSTPYLTSYELTTNYLLVGMREERTKDEDGKNRVECKISDIREIPFDIDSNDKYLFVRMFFNQNIDESREISENMMQYIFANKEASKENQSYVNKINKAYENDAIKDFEEFFEGNNLDLEEDIPENRYETFYNRLRNIYGYGKDVTEDSLIFRAIKDINPEIDTSIMRTIKDNYEIILAYKEGSDDYKDEQLTPKLLYQIYNEINKRPKSNINYNKSIDPEQVRKMTIKPVNITDIEFSRECVNIAINNLREGQNKFERDILEGRIVLPINYQDEVDSIKDEFRKENEKDIILDIIEDDTVPEIFLSGQMRMLKNFNETLIRDYHFNERIRRTLISSAYDKIENNAIAKDNRDFIESYIDKQLVPREIKLDKVLSLHTVSKKRETEIVYETEKKELVKVYNEEDKSIHIQINFKKNGKEIDLGKFEETKKTQIINKIEATFGNDKAFNYQIDKMYNNYFQMSAQKPKNVRTIQEEYKINAENILKNGAIAVFKYDKRGNIEEVATFYRENSDDEKLVSEIRKGQTWEVIQEKSTEDNINSFKDYINKNKDSVIPVTIKKENESIIRDMERNKDKLIEEGNDTFYDVLGKQVKEKIVPHKSTYKNSRSQLQEALAEGKFVTIADYSDPIVNNNKFKILTINDLGETVCLEVSKKGPYLLESINEADYQKKLKVSVKVLDGEELNDTLKRATRKNTSTRVFSKEELGTLMQAWDIQNNKLIYNNDLTDSLRTTINATTGYAKKDIDSVMADVNSEIEQVAELENITFVAYDNEKGNIRNLVKLEKIADTDDKYEISIIRKVDNQESYLTFKAKKENGKFEFDEEAYKDEENINVRNAIKDKIEELNFDLSSPTKQVSIYSNKDISKVGTNKIFEFKKQFNFSDKCLFNKVLNQAKSDGTNRLDALYSEGLLGKLIEKDKVFVDRGLDDDKITELSNPKEVNARTALENIGFTDDDIDHLNRTIDIYENTKSIRKIVALSEENLNNELSDDNETEKNDGTFKGDLGDSKEPKQIVSIPGILLNQEDLDKALFLISHLSLDEDYEKLRETVGTEENKEALDNLRKDSLNETNGTHQIYKAVKNMEEDCGFLTSILEEEQEKSKLDKLRNKEIPTKEGEEITLKRGDYTFKISLAGKSVSGKDRREVYDISYLEISKDGNIINNLEDDKSQKLINLCKEIGISVSDEQREQREKINKFIKSVDIKDSSAVYSLIKIMNSESTSKDDIFEGYKYFIDSIKRGEKLFQRSTIMQEDIRYRAEKAESLEELILSQNEVDSFFAKSLEDKNSLLEISDKSIEDKIKILEEITSKIDSSEAVDEKVHNRTSMESIFMKRAEVLILKDISNKLDNLKEEPDLIKKIENISKNKRVVDAINNEIEISTNKDGDSTNLDKILELSKEKENDGMEL